MFPLHSSRVRSVLGFHLSLSAIILLTDKGNPHVQKIFHFRHEISQHPELDVESDGDADRDSLGYYKCRGGACRQVFTTSATRKRYIYMTWFNVIPCLTFTFLL